MSDGVRAVARGARRLAIAGLAFATAGCAAGLQASRTERARALEAPADRALVYILRYVNEAPTYHAPVTCDGRELGRLPGRKFMVFDLPPGPHLFVAEGEDSNALPIVLEPGKTYYFEQNVHPNFLFMRARLDRLEDRTGRARLERVSLAREAALPGEP